MRIGQFAFESLAPEEMHANSAFVATQRGDNVIAVDIAPPPPPPPSFNEAELEAAKQAAYEEGFMAGKLEGRREVDHESMEVQQNMNQVCTTISHHIDNLTQQHQQYLISKQADLGRLVLGCSERLAVEALRKEPLADIEAMVRDCLGLMMGKPEVTVKVHPKLQQPLMQKFGNRIKVISNPEMNPVDCHIAWSYGEATREIDKIWGNIEETIDRYFAISATEMSQQTLAQSTTTHESHIDNLPEGEDHGGSNE
jgi:flagellar assembly protein FliH